FTLGQQALAELEFPVGTLSKTEVRAVAARHCLPTSRKPESMEICFVPDGDYAGFVERVAGPQPEGNVVDARGRILARHSGTHRSTIGQRRGLGVAAATPLYVQEIDAANHRVVVGPARDLERTSFTVLQPTWTDRPPSEEEILQVRVRHRHGGAPARVIHQQGRLTVHSQVPLRAVAPGQAAVFYRGDEVLGGGWIG